jgi:hypothetical protein
LPTPFITAAAGAAPSNGSGSTWLIVVIFVAVVIVGAFVAFGLRSRSRQ